MTSTINTPYEDSLKKILENGEVHKDRTGTGTLSIFHHSMSYDLNEGFPLITTKKLFSKGIIEELLWFISGDTNEHTLRDKNVHFWKEWARDDGELGPVYGKQLRNLESVQMVKPYIFDYIGDLTPTVIVDNIDGKDEHTEFLLSSWTKMITGLNLTSHIEGNTPWSENEHVHEDWLTFSNFHRDARKLPGWTSAIDNKSDYVLDKSTKMMSNRFSPETTIWSPSHVADINNNGGLRSHNGSCFVYRRSDQLEDIISSIRHNPDSRRHVISLWNSADINSMELPPCHGAIIQFYVNDGKLSCHMLQRSADMFLGVPFNIASYSLLTHLIAQQTGLDVGTFTWIGGDCHIYLNHVEQVKELLSREPRNYPKIRVNKKASIDSYTIDDIEIIGYNPHPIIKADVAV